MSDISRLKSDKSGVPVRSPAFFMIREFKRELGEVKGQMISIKQLNSHFNTNIVFFRTFAKNY